MISRCVIIAALLVATIGLSGCAVRTWEQIVPPERRTFYQSTVQAYSQELRPGMSRKEVESYLRGRRIVFQHPSRFRQEQFLHEPNAWADLVEIGHEKSGIFICGRDHVMVGLIFAPREKRDSLRADESDILREVRFLAWAQCKDFDEVFDYPWEPARPKEKAARIVEVKKYCDRMGQRAATTQPTFLLSNAEANDTGWRFHADRDELAKTQADDAAAVWQSGMARFTFTSESGDWTHYVNYDFFPNGRRACVSSELRTFYGDIIAKRKWLFDSKGELLEQSTEYLDLHTEQPREPGDTFIDRETPVYKRWSDLPFSRQLEQLFRGEEKRIAQSRSKR